MDHYDDPIRDRVEPRHPFIAETAEEQSHGIVDTLSESLLPNVDMGEKDRRGRLMTQKDRTRVHSLARVSINS